MSKQPTWIGRFDHQHIARLRFHLHSPKYKEPVPFEGIIDTGFTGFIQIPLDLGAILGLVTQNLPVGDSLLANGMVQRALLARSRVTISGETRSGICQMPIAATCPILIGIDLLRRFDRMLIVSYKRGIHLIPERPIS